MSLSTVLDGIIEAAVLDDRRESGGLPPNGVPFETAVVAGAAATSSGLARRSLAVRNYHLAEQGFRHFSYPELAMNVVRVVRCLYFVFDVAASRFQSLGKNEKFESWTVFGVLVSEHGCVFGERCSLPGPVLAEIVYELI